MATPIPVNHARFSLREVVRVCAGDLVGEPEAAAEIVGVSTDSRTVPAGGLFVALSGERFDGHDFVDAARARGALPLVGRGRSAAGPRIEVDDPLVALGALASAWLGQRRSLAPLPLLAIGGAAGKTSTKTLAAAAVRALCGETLVTPGNLNNRIGVPMTLLTLSERHRAAVVECGTSEPGEIAELGAILAPDVGLVINVGIEHSEKLGPLERIADEEAALLEAAGRAAVTSADEPLLVERLGRVGGAKRVTFGTSESADFRLLGREVLPTGGSVVRWARRGGAEESLRTRHLGPAAARNVLAAIAGTLSLLDRDVEREELDALASALEQVDPAPGRMNPRRVGGRLVLDDSYNSNPKSVLVALDAAREIAATRGSRFLAALGDMLELGELAASEHASMVRAAVSSGAARLVLIGAESTAAAGRVRPPVPFSCFPDSASAAAEIAQLSDPGDVVLVKGSRSIATERLIEALEPPSRPAARES